MMGLLRAFGALFLNIKANPSGSRSDDGNGSAPAEHDRGTVLVIDDDPDMLTVLRPVLRAEGFNVLTAVSGAKGLDLLRYCQRDVRVVVLDYNMPRLNGADTLAFLRKLSPHVKVLAVTGVDANLLPESFRTGVDRVLTKPYTNSQLIDNLNGLLGFDPRTELAAS
jgi:CheY-like chemotaxis protein